jgi:hypothetical protein
MRVWNGETFLVKHFSVDDDMVHHGPFHDASFDLELFSSRCRIAHHEVKGRRCEADLASLRRIDAFIEA